MARTSRDTAGRTVTMEGYRGHIHELDGYTVEFGSFTADADPAPLFAGLPDDRCQCPHWGVVLRGKLVYRHTDGSEDVMGAGLQAAAPHVGDVTDAAATARRRRRLVLADPPGGPLLALLWLAPGMTTGIHGHGSWVVVLVLEGRDRYQCWQPAGGGAARLANVRELRGGEVAWFAGPPGDVHRQQVLDQGVLELLLFGRDPRTMPRRSYRPEVTP